MSLTGKKTRIREEETGKEDVMFLNKVFLYFSPYKNQPYGQHPAHHTTQKVIKKQKIELTHTADH